MSVQLSGRSPSATPARTTSTRRPDADLPGRLALSAAAARGVHLSTTEFREWFAAHRREGHYRVTRAPLAALDGWSFEAASGNLVHRSGRFFSVIGAGIRSDSGPVTAWHQPILDQPEVGVLGILAKEFDGVLHFLMQAKMEPGNSNVLQLSPTVQATRSNFTRVHGGAVVKYIEYFTTAGRGRGRVLADSLQSEVGTWFLQKSNRNMVVEVFDEVPLHDGFVWLTLSQIAALLCEDNVVNMNARSVLACLPVGPADPADGGAGGRDEFARALDRSWDPASPALHSDLDVLSWLTGERARRDLVTCPVPLAGLPGWRVDDDAIRHEAGRYFEVVGVDVEAGSREVTTWSQPLLAPVGTGVAAFLAAPVDGVLHVLVQARPEAGLHNTVQLAPTVQCTAANFDWLPPERRPAFLGTVLAADAAAIRYEAVHAEEGGRFLGAESRCLVVEVPADAVAEEPPGHRWVTLAQLSSFVRYEQYVNSQARTLLSCLIPATVATWRHTRS
ncbi:oxidase EvaA [Streptomyces misionensis]|uniref:Oxidase EvaA n=1 Tax=Streptomyces misionensis TaxID=67331 RepID=A0A1H4I9S3_9ACTN|nr:NDP-hexose 2,3-dehydratase family protein [Streptomyces misionensis]SEB30807.1 oxidase EvaA [Streptomyces misionensis]